MSCELEEEKLIHAYDKTSIFQGGEGEGLSQNLKQGVITLRAKELRLDEKILIVSHFIKTENNNPLSTVMPVLHV